MGEEVLLLYKCKSKRSNVSVFRASLGEHWRPGNFWRSSLTDKWCGPKRMIDHVVNQHQWLRVNWGSKLVLSTKKKQPPKCSFSKNLQTIPRCVSQTADLYLFKCSVFEQSDLILWLFSLSQFISFRLSLTQFWIWFFFSKSRLLIHLDRSLCGSHRNATEGRPQLYSWPGPAPFS